MPPRGGRALTLLLYFRFLEIGSFLTACIESVFSARSELGGTGGEATGITSADGEASVSAAPEASSGREEEEVAARDDAAAHSDTRCAVSSREDCDLSFAWDFEAVFRDFISGERSGGFWVRCDPTLRMESNVADLLAPFGRTARASGSVSVAFLASLGSTPGSGTSEAEGSGEGLVCSARDSAAFARDPSLLSRSLILLPS